MKNVCSSIFSAFLLLSLCLSFINADLITPGTKTIPIENTIQNFNDFPDYYFIAVCTTLSSQTSAQIMDNEVIPFACSYRPQVSVYIVKKSDFDVSYVSPDVLINASYFNTSIFTKVISGVSSYETVAISSTQEKIVNNYNVDKSLLLTGPSNVVVARNWLIYLYIGIPVLVLIIIAVILIRRKNAASV